MTVNNTYITYFGDSTTTTFSIPFRYNKKAEVVVLVNSVDFSGKYTFLNDQTIKFNNAPLIGDAITIKRETDIVTPEIVWKNGSNTTSSQLNIMVRQLINGLQEAKDTAERGIFADVDGTFDFHRFRIKNLSDPVNPQDAANKQWVETGHTSSLNRASVAVSEAQAFADLAKSYKNAAEVAANSAIEIAEGEGYLTKGGNLSGLANKATARLNLGLGSAAIVDAENFNTRANNLSDIADVASARSNLGLGSMATESSSAWQAMIVSRLPVFAAGTALPTANIGPILHADFAAIMTWRTIGAFSGYASVNMGEVSAFASTVPPPGWLRCNGATLSAADAALIAFTGKNVLPDLRAEFIRGWDDGRGVDAARVLGSAQADEIKEHAHIYNRPTSGALYWGGNLASGVIGVDASAVTNKTGGTETRPRNVALLYCIKR